MARATALILLALVASGCHVSERAMLARADRIAETLPTYPDAELIGRSSSTSYAQEFIFSHATGYERELWYRVPRRIEAAQVVTFYDRRLATEWKRVPSEIAEITCWSRPDGASLTLLAEGVEEVVEFPSYQLYVGVDSTLALC